MRTNRKTRTYSVDDVQFNDSEDFRNHIVAQDDDCDYDESGWVAVVKNDVAGLAKYSHCSCFGTWTALHGGSYSDSGGQNIVWDWIGSLKNLIKMAQRNADPHMPERTACPEDYDYDHLQQVYQQVLKWSDKFGLV